MRITCIAAVLLMLSGAAYGVGYSNDCSSLAGWSARSPLSAVYPSYEGTAVSTDCPAGQTGYFYTDLRPTETASGTPLDLTDCSVRLNWRIEGPAAATGDRLTCWLRIYSGTWNGTAWTPTARAGYAFTTRVNGGWTSASKLVSAPEDLLNGVPLNPGQVYAFRLDVVFWDAKYAPCTISFDHLDFGLPGTVNARVLYAGQSVGSAVVGVKVGAKSQATANADQYITCDSNGEAVIGTYAPGTVLTLAAWKFGYMASADASVTVQSGTTEEITLNLEDLGYEVQTQRPAFTNWGSSHFDDWGTYRPNPPENAFDGYGPGKKFWISGAESVNDTNWWEHPWEFWNLPDADRGVITAITNSTLSDAGKSWTSDEWAGHYLCITDQYDTDYQPDHGGTKAPAWRTYKIVSNTGDTLTIDTSHSPYNDLLIAGAQSGDPVAGSGWKYYIRDLASNYPGTVKLWVDLGRDLECNYAEIYTRHEGYTANKLQYCPDGYDPVIDANWITVYDSGPSAAESKHYPDDYSYVVPYRFAPASGRYWRLWTDSTMFSILWVWEFRLFATESNMGSVSLDVTSNGDPVPGALVGVKAADTESLNAFANATTYFKADANGHVDVGKMIKGTVASVGAYAWGFNPSKDYFVTIQEQVDNHIAVDLEIQGVAEEVGGLATSNYPYSEWDPLEHVADGLGIIDPGHKAYKPGDFPASYINVTGANPSQVPTPPLWITIDLGANKGIIGAHLDMLHEPLTDYQIQALPAGYDPSVEANWAAYGTVAYSVTDSNGGCPNTPGENWPQHQPAMRFEDPDGNPITVTARYWRLYITKAPFSTFGLREFFLYGTQPSFVPMPTDNRIGSARKLEDGESVALMNKIVTASWVNVPEGSFYVEDVNRASGVRVIASTIPEVGHVVKIVGTMATVDGERVIQATTVADGGAASKLEPLGMTNRSVDQSLAEGLLVNVWGRVTSQTDDGFVLTDGSSAEGVRIVTGNARPGVGDYISIPGVAGRAADIWDPGTNYRVIYATSTTFTQGDIGADGWIQSWLLNGLWQVADPGQPDPAWQMANLAEDFLGGETSAYPWPGAVTGGKTWFAFTQLGLSPVLDLNTCFPTDTGQRSGYACVYIDCPADYTNTMLELRVGSDDGVKVWINDQMVWNNDAASRGVTPDEDLIPNSDPWSGEVSWTLLPGRNRLLLKVNNIGGGYGFCARFFYDSDGDSVADAPIPNLKYSLAPPI